MGIPNLNRYLKQNCKSSIKMIHLSELKDKVIVIDISIYLYRYVAENALIENVYLLLSIFRHYNIRPVFIFDGVPPDEKLELLKKRKADKVKSEAEYNDLKNKLSQSNTLTFEEKQEITSSMDALKKKFVYLTKNHIQLTKQLINSYGATYIDAPGEADGLCASFVLSGKAWACMSDDMDMFVYGCTKILRYTSLLNHTAVLYDVHGILDTLDMTHDEFKDVCVLSGTDYNTNGKTSLYSSMTLFNKYKSFDEYDAINSSGFYRWLRDETDYIDSDDMELLLHTRSMFTININLITINTDIIDDKMKRNEIVSILKNDGFLFPDKMVAVK
uniref:XPG N-terminal domain-containing protein n=1 Tax=viral metagenome TaxID=1070528 RepID=A0A6C0E3N6_9ZZZZ